MRAQKVFCEGNALKLVFDGSDLDLGLSSGLQDVAVLNGIAPPWGFFHSGSLCVNSTNSQRDLRPCCSKI